MKAARLIYHEERGWEIEVDQLLTPSQLAAACTYARMRRIDAIRQMVPGPRKDRDLAALRALRPDRVHQVLPRNKEVVLL
jgi:hypothetical protein